MLNSGINMKKEIRNLIKFILAYICTLAAGILTGWGISRIDLLLPLLCLVFYILFDGIHERIICRNREWSILRTLALNGVTRADIKSELRYALPLAVIFSLSVVAGRHLDVWEDVIIAWSITDILWLIVYLLLFSALLIILYRVTDRRLDEKISETGAEDITVRQPSSHDADADRIKPSRVLARAGILMLCYLPYYLTLFPGNLGKDTFESVDMVLGIIPWTNHHPIFFTMLIDAVFSLTGWSGSYTASLGIFTFLHMTAFALTLSYITCRIRIKEQAVSRTEADGTDTAAGSKVSRIRWSTAALIFFALHPFFPMYSIYITKDVLFSCALAILVIKLSDRNLTDDRYDTSVISSGSGKRRGQSLSLTLISLLVMLLRNNGLMIIALLTIIIFVSDDMRNRKALKASGTNTEAKPDAQKANGLKPLIRVAPFMASIVIFLIFKAVSYNALNIEPESFAESASIPLQQVAYVTDTHTDEELNESLGSTDSEILSKIMPYDRVREVFDLGYTDPVKFDESFDDVYFNEHKGDFLRIWARLLPRYLGDYVSAYLAQTAGYWNYGQANTVATQGVWEDNEIGVDRIDVIERMTGTSLYGIIEKLMLGMRKAPLLCILSSMAMEFYAVLLAIVILRRRGVRPSVDKDEGLKIRSAALSFTPLILLWVTIMIAAPAFCLFRYMFAFFILWPYTMYVILCGGVNG